MKCIEINGHETFKLTHGDFITIRWYDENGNATGYAYDLRYEGRNNECGYVFKSLIYGWNYVVDKNKETLYNDYSPDVVYKVDARSGWTTYLPD